MPIVFRKGFPAGNLISALVLPDALYYNKHKDRAEADGPENREGVMLMLRVIFGEKGAGKTKRIIDEANALINTAKGTIVYIDDDKSYTRDIKHQIRFVDASEYEIDSPKMFLGFISGIAAQDFDLEALYIDGFLKTVRTDLDELEDFFKQVEQFSIKFNVNVTISINSKGEPAPAFLEQYLA